MSSSGKIHHPHHHDNAHYPNSMSQGESFVNRFWGKHDAGLCAIELRVSDALHTMHALVDYYHLRIEIESLYAKKLDKLANRKIIGTREIGTLGHATSVFEAQQLAMAQNSHKFAQQVYAGNYTKLKDFCTKYKASTFKMTTHMRKLAQREKDESVRLGKAKEKYRDECAHVKRAQLLIQTTVGKEHDKIRANLSKLQQAVPELQQHYLSAITRYRDVLEAYQRDWHVSLRDFYRLEHQRIEFLKVNCFGFFNSIASHCVENDLAADFGRQACAKVLWRHDMHKFCESKGTGDHIYRAPQFIDFMQGYVDDELEEGDGTVKYDCANFPDPEIEGSGRQDGSSPLRASPVKRLPPPVLAPEGNKSFPRLVPETGDTIGSGSRPRRHSDTSSIFSCSKSKFGDSGGSSQPLSVLNSAAPYNVDSQGKRHWASPRRKESQLAQMQQEIDERQLRSQAVANEPAFTDLGPKVSLVKDFSIDCIAKALEDLQQGGNGDVNHLRRLVRVKLTGDISQHFAASSSSMGRQESINFGSPETHGRRSVLRLRRSSRRSSRRLSGLPTTSYGDLYTIATRKATTPFLGKPYVTKARARYGFHASEPGELEFKKGWYMYVIYKQEDNWYWCELGKNAGQHEGEVGLVPGNYVVEGNDLF